MLRELFLGYAAYKCKIGPRTVEALDDRLVCFSKEHLNYLRLCPRDRRLQDREACRNSLRILYQTQRWGVSRHEILMPVD
jgi:hypothetical protein